MRTEYDRPVRYFLALGDGEIPMNDLIGRPVMERRPPSDRDFS